jgi:hypothetical protein
VTIRFWIWDFGFRIFLILDFRSRILDLEFRSRNWSRPRTRPRPRPRQRIECLTDLPFSITMTKTIYVKLNCKGFGVQGYALRVAGR